MLLSGGGLSEALSLPRAAALAISAVVRCLDLLSTASQAAPAMTTNRISISSSPRGPRAPHFADEPSRIASSLDAVFSYQRSAGFLAESLRSSHVDEAGNVRHPDYEDDDDDDVGSIAEQERRWRARLEEEDQDDDDEDRVGHTFSPASAGSKHNDFWTTSVSQSYDSGAESDSGPPAALLVDTAGPDSRSHALPPNALGTSPASIGVHYNDLPDSAGERSPLLGRTRSRGAMSQVGRPGAPSFLSVETNDSRAPRQRRSSVFSREAWKAKIEEHRGESTWGQTLFNCINVLVGVGLLADPLAFADAGWILGTLLLLYCALVTNCRFSFLFTDSLSGRLIWFSRGQTRQRCSPP